MTKKKASIANFNVVFLDGKTEKPLLSYFDTIIYPALNSGYIREAENSSFRFLEAKVVKNELGEYIFTGLIVKKTILEIKSDLDENGNLIPLDDRYSSAPYSIFVIYLKNHRMLFVENQKGSPNLQSFTAAVRYCINRYTKEENRRRKEQHEEPLPIPMINVTGILFRGDIEKILKNVKKINLLTLRFYPLNGDNDYSGMLGSIAKELRQFVDANNGEVQLKSPKNTKNIVSLLENTEGTVKPILRVTYLDKKKGKITDKEISENMQIEVVNENAEDGIEQIIDTGYSIPRLQNVSDQNLTIYNKNIEKLEKLSQKQ